MLLRYLLILGIVSAATGAHAQFGAYDHVKISEKNIKKLDKISSPAKKLKAYKKFYSKDSVKLVRNLNRYWKQKSDSLTNAAANGTGKIREEKNRLGNKAKDIAKQAKATTLINESMYKMPSEIEAHFTPGELLGIYTSMREFLIEVVSDTMKFNIPGVKLNDLPFAGKASELKGKLNIPAANRPQVPSISHVKSGLRSKALGIFKKRNIANNAGVKYALEMKARTADYHKQVLKYKELSNMSVDSLRTIGTARLERETIERLTKGTDFQSLNAGGKELKEMQALQAQFKDQAGVMSDSARMKEAARKKAAELAMNYLEQNPAALKAAQKKMSLLMRKYSFVPNSNDLSTAIKKTSLKGRAFRERLIIATNFQVLSLDPVAFDFSPQVGYKFNTRLAIGVGGTYRQTLKDSVPTLSPSVLGYKSFISFEFYKSFFAYTEFARNSPGVVKIEDQTKRLWTNALFLGAGRTFAVHKKIDMTVVALYDVLHKHGDPIYPRPFIVRFGFQLSELALLKKKPEMPKW